MKQKPPIIFIKETVSPHINENQYVDRALEKIKKLGGFKNLPDIDKLALLTDTGNEEALKKLSLYKIYKENGGTFGKLMVQIRVKEKGEQPINHRFSQEFAGQVGWLHPYIHYNDNQSYVTVRFNSFEHDDKIQGGGHYQEMPIMLDNMYPIGYNDIKSEFANYDDRIDIDRKEFLNRMKDLLGGFEY